MAHGKISYSPDYKSDKPPAVDYLSLTTEITVRCPECGNSDCEHANALAARAAEQYRERTRLERTVIETSKAARLAEHEHTKDLTVESWEAMVAAQVLRDSAVDALLAFESQQEKKS